ncbi:MAG: hypothetical protein HQK99_09715 [Nitrospirae bacterium]|nr:hypothetical protein [Nitrospirota bacterium]
MWDSEAQYNVARNITKSMQKDKSVNTVEKEPLDDETFIPRTEYKQEMTPEQLAEMESNLKMAGLKDNEIADIMAKVKPQASTDHIADASKMEGAGEPKPESDSGLKRVTVLNQGEGSPDTLQSAITDIQTGKAYPKLTADQKTALKDAGLVQGKIPKVSEIETIRGMKTKGDTSYDIKKQKEVPTVKLTDEEILKTLKDNATPFRKLELTPETWKNEFGENRTVMTPEGDVVIGMNQYLKLKTKDKGNREKYFGLIKPTLAEPLYIVEVKAPKEGAERDTKKIFIKSFRNEDGNTYFMSVTIQQGGKEISISSHPKDANNDLKGIIKRGEVLYPKSAPVLQPAASRPQEHPTSAGGHLYDSTLPHPAEPVKPENEGALDQTKKDITDEQKRILGENTKTEFVEGDVRKEHTPEEDMAALSKHGLTPETIGEDIAVGSHQFDKDNLVHSIKLSLMSPEEMRDTSLHEIGHGIQKTLEAMGRSKDMEILKAAHAKKAKANGEAVSETIADKFRDYVLNKEAEQKGYTEPKGLVRRIFDRIIEFGEKLKNYLNDRGFKSVNDIFGEAYRGELAGKEAEGRATEPEVNYSVKKDETDKEEQPKTKWQQLKEKNKAINTVSEAFSTRKDEIKSILTPMSMGEAAKTTGGIVRENAAEMVRKYDIAESAMRDTRAFFDKQDKQSNYDFIDNYETGKGQVNPKLQETAKTIKELLDARVKQVRNLGTGKLQNLIEDYFPHLWKDPEQAKNFIAEFYAKQPMEGSGAFLKKRSIPTVKDGLAYGLEPAFDNPIDMALAKMREMDKYIMAHKTLNEMKAPKVGLAKYVPSGQKAPDGWQKIDDKIATVFGPREMKVADLTPAERVEAEQMAKITGQSVEDVIHGEEFKKVAGLRIMGNYYAPAEAARLINNYLSPGLRDKSQLFRDYLGATNVLNQFQLGLSAFHGGFITVESIASKFSLGLLKAARGDVGAGAKDMIFSITAPFDYWKSGNKLMKEWYNPTGQGEIGDIAQALQAAGGRARMDEFYRTHLWDNMMKAIRQQQWGTAAWHAIPALVEKAAKPIMEGFVPRMKLGSFYHIMEMEMKNNPNMSHEELRQVAGKVWDSVDNRMGQLVYDNLFWNKTTKDIAMASVRSVGWNLGSFREMLGGVKDIGNAGVRLAKGEKPTGDMMSYRASYLIGMPIMVGLMGAATQYLITGKGPDDLKDLYFPKTGNLDEHGRPERVTLPSYMKDIASYTQKPGQTLANKLHPALELVAEMLHNKDFYGTKIRNEDDGAIQQMLSLAEHVGKGFIPFAARGVQRGMKLNNGQVNAKTLLPMVGITQAPTYINQTPAERMMSNMIQAKMPQTGRTQEQQDKHDLKQSIERQMRINPQAAQQMLKDNADKLSTRDRLDIMKSRTQTPLTSAVSHLGFDEAVKVYQVATDDEKQKLRPLLQKKYQGAIAKEPLKQRAATIQQYKAAVGR